MPDRDVEAWAGLDALYSEASSALQLALNTLDVELTALTAHRMLALVATTTGQSELLEQSPVVGRRLLDIEMLGLNAAASLTFYAAMRLVGIVETSGATIDPQATMVQLSRLRLAQSIVGELHRAWAVRA